MAANQLTNLETNNKSERSSKMEQCYENLIVVDIGANLTNKKYSRDLESVIQRAKDAGLFQKYYVRFCGISNLLF